MSMVKIRQEVERRIVTQVVRDALAAGYSLNVDNGDGEDVSLNMRDEAAILGAMFAVDDEHLHFYRGEKHVGWVYFVYGNSGWDVISDYTVDLEDVLKNANALSDSLSA